MQAIELLQHAPMQEQVLNEQISTNLDNLGAPAEEKRPTEVLLGPAAYNIQQTAEVTGLENLSSVMAAEHLSKPQQPSLEGNHTLATESSKAKGLGAGLKQHFSFPVPSFKKLSSLRHFGEKQKAARAASAAAAEALGGEAVTLVGELQHMRAECSRDEQGGQGIAMQEAGEENNGEEEAWHESSELRLPSAMSSSPATPMPGGMQGRDWFLPQAPAPGSSGLPPELALLQRLQEYMAPGKGHSAGREAFAGQGMGSRNPQTETAGRPNDVDDLQQGQLALDQKLGLQRLRSAFGRSGRLGRRSSTEEGECIAVS
jgi:hypothetical protein